MEFAGRFIACGMLVATTAHAGWRVAAATMRGGSLPERLLGAAVCAVALLSMLVLALGIAGALVLPAVLAAHGVAWAAIAFATRRHLEPISWVGAIEAARLRPGARAVGVALWLSLAVLAGVAWQGLFRPDYDYDALTNHLFAPARWVQDHRVAIVDTPFGAPTAAYEPLTTELYYAWLMLPFHSDLLARWGQALHLAILYLALYVIARRLGLRRAPAAAAPLALHVAAPLVAQAAGAMTDLALAAWWTASLALVLRLRETRDLATAGLATLAAGLYAGTKFVALAYLPVLVVVVLLAGRLRGVRYVAGARWAVLAMVGPALLLGGFWYARNWLVAGNPLFPMRVELAGHEVWRGAFGAEQLEAWVFNRRVPGMTGRHVIEQLGESLGRGVIPLVLFALALARAAFARAGLERRPAIVMLGSAVAMVAVEWLVLPSHAPRFIFAALACWALAPAVLAGAGRAAGLAAAVLLAIHLGWSWGSYAEVLSGFAAGLVVLPLAGTLVLARTRYRIALAGLAAASIFALFIAMKLAHDRPLGVLRRELQTWGDVGAAWAWVGEHLRGVSIAYAGSNVPYFLLGPRFENRVFHVNADGTAGSYHDHFRRHARDYAEPFTPEPAYYRMELDEAAWLDALRAAGADYLFVAALPWNERVNHRHSSEGFVAEESWARGQPGRFRPLFSNPQVRLFEVDSQGAARSPSRPVRRTEIDAVELYLKEPDRLDRLYPGARAFIEHTRLAEYARTRAQR